MHGDDIIPKSRYSAINPSVGDTMAVCNIDDTESGEGIQFYPPHVWGLDYHFNTYNKMYIADILSMEPYPKFTGAFCYKNHPIYKVDIVGTVVKKTENSKCFIYAVDDGTGVILSCCWKENFYRPQVGTSTFTYLPGCLKDKLRDIERDRDSAVEGYLLGDLVNMKGKVKIFREKKEVVVNQHFKVDNPMFQVVRMLELPKVYSLYYDKPFQPPRKVLQVLNMNNQHTETGNKPELVNAMELKHIIFNVINSGSNKCELVPTDILQFSSVKNFMSTLQISESNTEKQTQLVVHALSLMEEDGHVIKRGDRRMLYEVLLHGSRLEQTILKILQTETALPKYAEKGCHYMHITDELQKTLQYSKVKKDTVLNCLQKLETQSDVIRSTHAHFLPCVV